MPYVDQESRNHLNAEIIELADKINICHNGISHREGRMNYTISKLINEVYGPDWCYSKINEIIGILECVKQEYYRKVAAAYEDTKEVQNGPVYR